jgi:predicted GNAT family acetyltransferase
MLEVQDNPRFDRYELFEEGERVGFLAYRRAAGAVALTHAEVRADRRGEGLAEVLVAGALEDLRAQGDRVRPTCGYVAAYVRRHPEQADLVAR